MPTIDPQDLKQILDLAEAQVDLEVKALRHTLRQIEEAEPELIPWAKKKLTEAINGTADRHETQAEEPAPGSTRPSKAPAKKRTNPTQVDPKTAERLKIQPKFIRVNNHFVPPSKLPKFEECAKAHPERCIHLSEQVVGMIWKEPDGKHMWGLQFRAPQQLPWRRQVQRLEKEGVGTKRMGVAIHQNARRAINAATWHMLANHGKLTNRDTAMLRLNSHLLTRIGNCKSEDRARALNECTSLCTLSRLANFLGEPMGLVLSKLE